MSMTLNLQPGLEIIGMIAGGIYLVAQIEASAKANKEAIEDLKKTIQVNTENTKELLQAHKAAQKEALEREINHMKDLINATSNETAIRLTALTCDGVSNVILKPYSMGAGSFTVILLIDSNFDDENVIATVNNTLKNVHGYGIRYNVITPTLSYIKIKHHVIIKDNISDVEKQEIRYNVQLALSDYLNNLNIGENLNTDKITQLIMNVSDNIIEESNMELYIDGDKALYVNQSCRWFERFVLSKESDNVIII